MRERMGGRGVKQRAGREIDGDAAAVLMKSVGAGVP